MKTAKKAVRESTAPAWRVLVLGLLCWLPVLLAAQGGQAASSKTLPLVVVVSQKAELVDLSMQELKQIFLAERKTLNGKRVIPLDPDPHTPTRIQFDRIVLGMTPDQVGRYWVERKIRGQGDPPRTISASALLLKIVANRDEFISYVRADQLVPGVRAIRVDGKTYQDRDYPLQGEKEMARP